MKNILIFDKNKDRHLALGQRFAELDNVQVYRLDYDQHRQAFKVEPTYVKEAKGRTFKPDELHFDVFLIHGTNAASLGLPAMLRVKKKIWFGGGSGGKFAGKESEDEIIYRAMPHADNILSRFECEQLLEYIDENIAQRPVFLQRTGRDLKKEAIVKIVDMLMEVTGDKFDLNAYADQIKTLCGDREKEHVSCLQLGESYLNQVYDNRPTSSDLEAGELRVFYQKIATVRDKLFERYIDDPNQT